MIKQKLNADIVAAMKQGDSKKLEVLRFLMSQIKNAEIDGGRKELSDEQLVKLIAGQIKKLNESLQLFAKGKREDLIGKTKDEIVILSAYLPVQMNDEELEKRIDKVISDNPEITNPGALIGIAVKALTRSADAGRIAQKVNQKLRR